MRYQGTVSWAIAKPKRGDDALTDEQYLFVKRETISGGMAACALALAKVLGKKRDYIGNAREGFLWRLCNDDRRDDVHLGKCMHCMFNRHCNSMPPSCAYIDSRVRRFATSFKIWEFHGQWEGSDKQLKMVYDCGWAMVDGKVFSPDAKRLSDFEWPIVIEPRMTLERCRPFRGGLCQHHIMPNRGESYEAYRARVIRYKDEIAKMVNNHTKDDIELQLRRIINKLGQHDVLMGDYGGDVRFMVADYWPKKTMEQVVAMYAGGSVPVAEDDFKYIQVAVKERQDAKGGADE